MQRFLDTDRTYSLEEVLDVPIELSAMPFEYNRDSPTPLDPHGLEVLGMAYPKVALEFMIGELTRNSSSFSGHAEQIAQAETEIEHQHLRRMKDNTDTMDRWREYAASHGDITLSHEDAEGVMQVRAGISKPRAVIELIARNPDTLGGGIEIAKSTRPLCLEAHVESRKILRDRLENISGIALNSENEAPYRFAIDQHNMALITKTMVGTVALQGARIEVVTRSSGILYNPQEAGKMPESIYTTIADNKFAVAPLDTTTYVRTRA